MITVIPKNADLSLAHGRVAYTNTTIFPTVNFYVRFSNVFLYVRALRNVLRYVTLQWLSHTRALGHYEAVLPKAAAVNETTAHILKSQFFG